MNQRDLKKLEKIRDNLQDMHTVEQGKHDNLLKFGSSHDRLENLTRACVALEMAVDDLNSLLQYNKK